ncbi:MAG: hypothetical protein HDT47_09540 [Ruminococcaceae bacterium]|nr:hypothetical protein [Oscillospiraceae bacterium]
MIHEITENQRDKMRYRRKVLQDRLKELEHLVTGRGESYLPLISNEKEKVTKEKTEQFISEMLGAFQRYIKFNPHRTLSGKTLEMYESFLYCAILSLDMEHSRRDYKVINWRISSVFEDIVNRAEKVEIVGCNSMDSYMKECYRAYRTACDMRDEHRRKSMNDPILRNFSFDIGPAMPETDSEFCIEVKRSLELLNYPTFIECFADEAMRKFREDYENGAEKPTVPLNVELPSFTHYDDEENGGFALRHERDRLIDEALDSLGEDETYDDSKMLKNFTDEEIRAREQGRAQEELYAVEAKWKDEIVFEGETLIQNFVQFLSLYFESPDRRYFAEDIRNMVDTFLYEHRISAFSLGNDYGMISYYIDRTKSRIEKEIERGGRK